MCVCGSVCREVSECVCVGVCVGRLVSECVCVGVWEGLVKKVRV